MIDGFDGLMARVNALNKLPGLPSLFIFYYSWPFETSTILAKLFVPKGPADLKLAEQEGAVASWLPNRKTQRDVLVGTDRELNNRVYADIAEEQNCTITNAKGLCELMQMQADAFYQNRKVSYRYFLMPSAK